MKAVLGQPGFDSSRQQAIHSVRNPVDKQRLANLAPNSSQKFVIDHHNMNFNSVQ